MTTTNKPPQAIPTSPFRIKNTNGFQATVTLPENPIYQVEWSDGVGSNVESGVLQNLLDTKAWQIVPEVVTKPTMPEGKTFKFKVGPNFCDDNIYTYDGNAQKYQHPVDNCWYTMSAEYMERAIILGMYIVQPSEPLQTESYEGYTAWLYKWDDEDVNISDYEDKEHELSFLDTIKSFTERTGVIVAIDDGSYVVYADNDSEYHADCEGELADVMNAIEVLKGAEKGGC